MSDDSERVVVTTRKGWGARIREALMGLIVGPIIIFGAGYLLTWNEGNWARMQEALTEERKNVVVIAPDAVNPAMDGKLVYTTGQAGTSEVLEDALFGVSRNALILRRESEMYQWKEDEEKRTNKEAGGGETTTTTYTYHKTWSSSLISSSGFERPQGHTNPSEFRYPPQEFIAKNARIGALRVDPELVSRISGGEQVILPPTHTVTSVNGIKVESGGLYIGANPAEPKIGDIRIRYSVVPAQVISIVAAQRGGTLAWHQARNGVSIGMVSSGVRTADQLFDAELRANYLIAWGIRMLGLFIMFIGFTVALSIFPVLADIVPFIGDLVAFGTGLIAFFCALAVWTTTVAVAWFAYRPIHAAILVAATAGLAAWLYRRRASKGIPAATAA